MYTTDHSFLVLPIKYLINKEGNPTTPFKLVTSMKSSVSHLRVLFCPCVVLKATSDIDYKALNMHHQAQKGFFLVSLLEPHHQKGYLVYVPSTRKIISSYDAVFGESFSSLLAYTSQPYAEAIYMRPAVSYIPCDKYSREQTGNKSTFAKFEEGDLLSETRYDTESSDKSDDE